MLKGRKVLITSKFVKNRNLNNLADMKSVSEFRSEDAADQWVCWDFRKTRIRPTHDTIRSTQFYPLKSWLRDGAVQNGRNLTGGRMIAISRFLRNYMVFTRLM
jgi:hypothetical protein